jgi:hypothetical protein
VEKEVAALGEKPSAISGILCVAVEAQSFASRSETLGLDAALVFFSPIAP